MLRIGVLQTAAQGRLCLPLPGGGGRMPRRQSELINRISYHPFWARVSAAECPGDRTDSGWRIGGRSSAPRELARPGIPRLGSIDGPPYEITSSYVRH